MKAIKSLSLPFLRKRQGSGWLPVGISGGLFLLMIGFGPSQATWALEGAGDKVSEKESSSIALPKKFRGKAYIKRRWGVEVMFVRQSAAGYMLEFRYKVLDPEKAKPLIVRKIKPNLTHVKTGAKLVVPAPQTTGPMRNTYDQMAGQVYWMFFANPGKLVKPGDQVDIEIGEFLVKGLVVK